MEIIHGYVVFSDVFLKRELRAKIAAVEKQRIFAPILFERGIHIEFRGGVIDLKRMISEILSIKTLLIWTGTDRQPPRGSKQRSFHFPFILDTLIAKPPYLRL